MPPWLTDVLKLLGLVSPFAYGYAVYQICMHFDKRGISAKTRVTLSTWLEPKTYSPSAVSNALLALFDRVYSKPLFAWRAFRRSAVISLTIIVICLYEVWGPQDWTRDWSWGFWAYTYSNLIASNVISDYLSLFIVRYFLRVAPTKPVVTAFIAPLAGVLFVVSFWAGYDVLGVVIEHLVGFSSTVFDLWGIIRGSIEAMVSSPNNGLLAAALVVHLWLPLLALSVVLLKALNYFRAAVGMTQDFLSKGSSHPLEAIGYVAGAIVFVGTAVGRLVIW